MNKKRRFLVYIVSILALIAGFVALVVGGYLQETKEMPIEIFLIVAFAFWGGCVFLLLKNFSAMWSSEIMEKQARLTDEANYFTLLNQPENADTLKEKFQKAGYIFKNDYLFKKTFSLLTGHQNTYVFIFSPQDMPKHFTDFAKSITVGQQLPPGKIGCIYVLYFLKDVTENDLTAIKSFIIALETIAMYPLILPIVYNESQQQYIFRNAKKGFSIRPLDISMQNFKKIVLL